MDHLNEIIASYPMALALSERERVCKEANSLLDELQAGDLSESDRREKQRAYWRIHDKCEALKTRVKRYEYALPNALHRSMTFDADRFPDSKASKVARGYVADFDNMCRNNIGLLFVGGVGTGKTFYAACILNELCRLGKNVQMSSFRKFINLSADELEPELDRVRSFDLIAFDDLGAERSTDFGWERVFLPLDERVCAEKPFIVTTNISLAEMTGTQDIRAKRVYDRVLGVCQAIPIDGETLRRSNAEQKADILRAAIDRAERETL